MKGDKTVRIDAGDGGGESIIYKVNDRKLFPKEKMIAYLTSSINKINSATKL